jgi:hypothetical protein
MNSKIRFFLITCCTLLMIWFGFKRERNLLIVSKGNLEFINRYQPFPKTDYKNEMKNFTGFHLSNKLQSSVFFSFLFMILATAIVYLYSQSQFLAKLTFSLYVIYFLLCFAFILLGNSGVDYRLSFGLSHYLEDLFLSPFFVMTLIVLIKAFGLSNTTVKET